MASAQTAEPAAVRIGTAPLVSPDAAKAYFDGLGNGVTPDTFALPTDDVDGIVATVGRDPAALAGFVRDNIDMVWSYGLGRGARAAAIDHAGTAFDQAQLLVELLKAAGDTSARYQLGRLTLTGAQFQAWTGITSAKAACQLLSSGGIPASINGETKADCGYTGTVSEVVMGHVWVQATVNGKTVIYDPSVKTYARNDKAAPVPVAAKAGYAAGSALSVATDTSSTDPADRMKSGSEQGVDYVQALRGGALDGLLDTRAGALLADTDAKLLAEDKPAGRLADLVNEAEIQPGTDAGGPSHGNVDATWADIPDAYRTKLRVEVRFTKVNRLSGLIEDIQLLASDLFADRIAAHKLVLDNNFNRIEAAAPSTQTSGNPNSGLNKLVATLRLRGEDIGDIDLVQGVVAQEVRDGRATRILLTANHPYAALAGAYMDAQVTKAVDLTLPVAIVNGWGWTGPQTTTRWGSRLDRLSPATNSTSRGCDDFDSQQEPTCSPYMSTIGDARREQMAGAWLAQSGTAARLHATLADAHFVQHHSLGVVAADIKLSAIDRIKASQGDSAGSSQWFYTIADSFDRIDIDSAISLTSRTADTVARRAGLLATAHTLEALEGQAPVEAADTPDAVSTTTRLAWANQPSTGYTGNDPALNTDPAIKTSTTTWISAGPRRFYQYNKDNAAQATALTLVEGMAERTDKDPLNPNDPLLRGNGAYVQGLGSSNNGFKTRLAAAVATYANAGFQVVTSAESFLGPGARIGDIGRNSSSDASGHNFVTYTHSVSRARGGALIATKYDAQGEPVEIAHVAVNFNSLAKGGGAGIQSFQKAQYDPSTAADVLKAKFVDRSSERGVDLKSGKLTYQSPVGLTVGSGKFPYQLSASMVWRGGQREQLGQTPQSAYAPQTPWTTNWASSASFSSSVAEMMGSGDLRATAGTVVAFLALQDIYRADPSPQREAVAALAANWWLGKAAGNVVTLTVGSTTQQFVRLTNGSWISPGGSPAMLSVTGSRKPYIESSCITSGAGGGASATYPQNRGWDYRGLVLSVTSPSGDTQRFDHAFVTDTTEYYGCFVQQGFRLARWDFKQGVNIYLTYDAAPGQQQNLLSVTNNLGRRLTFGRSGKDWIDNGLTGGDRRVFHTNDGWSQSGPDGQVHGFAHQVVNDQYRLTEVQRPLPATPYIRWTYDALSRVKGIADAQAVADPASRGAWGFAYAAGLGGVRTDPLGGRYAAHYDTDGRLRRVLDELGRATLLTPDGRGRVVEYLYPMGEKQLLTYDTRNNPTSLTRVARSGPASTSVKVAWHPTLNKPTSITDARLAVTSLTYDTGTGLLTRLEQPAVTPYGGSAARPTTNFTYDDFGRLEEATDPTGMVTEYFYTPGNETLASQVVDKGSSPHKNLTTSFTYNVHGDLTGVTTPRGALVSADYNVRRQPLYEETRAGATALAPQTSTTLLSRTEWVYDAVGRVEAEKRSSDMPGIPYAVTTTLYSPTDKPTRVTDPLNRVTQTDYDALDRAIRVTDPLGRVSEVVYDIAGRKWKERSAVGTAVAQDSATYTYFSDDTVATITDPRGHALSHAYDGFGRLSVLSYAD
ncbi:hypothetical protein, partial [Niveispirillum sp. KHB5.9]|uniref:hypothetical protein n=1 Tax=Niveispirillum sp. KHB5.9 TaxID=3400269 RepID=UPI003A8576F8